MTLQSDDELVQSFLKGEESAFNELYRAYEKPLYSFILRYAGNRNTAEDLVQQVWMKVIKALPKYDERSKFGSWLFSIAHHSCIDAVRKKSPAAAADFDEVPLMEKLPGERPNPEEELIRLEERGLLEKAIQQLPDEQKEVLLMRIYSDLPFREIADILHAPLNTILGRMHYAMKHLRQTIMQLTEEDH